MALNGKKLTCNMSINYSYNQTIKKNRAIVIMTGQRGLEMVNLTIEKQITEIIQNTYTNQVV